MPYQLGRRRYRYQEQVPSAEPIALPYWSTP